MLSFASSSKASTGDRYKQERTKIFLNVLERKSFTEVSQNTYSYILYITKTSPTLFCLFLIAINSYQMFKFIGGDLDDRLTHIFDIA